jgi:cell fate regulator YaaT (PSP1 superfamily)
MGCSSCSTEGGTPRGCKNNGTCSSGGCNKLGVFDWLANMQLPNGRSQFDIVEIRFKNSRKSFYRNMKGLSLHVGDVVVVEASPGYDVGVVSVVGELARIQVQKKAPNFKPHEARQILRIASREDVDKWVAARGKEYETMHRARELAIRLKLEMKISDVEYQGDGSKATFFYTAEGRVDFRQLIKDMADAFRIRVEMRQIGARQESARLGGIGSCGRELCCSTWLTDFRTVSTSAARYQQLSLNPQKLAGQCGKLKCCLNFELDMYMEAFKGFPSSDKKLYTEKGSAFHIKTDVFKRLMWYIYESSDQGAGGMVALSPERVAQIIKMNSNNEKPVDLKAFEEEVAVVKEVDYTNVVGQDDLSRFDDVFKRKKKKRKKKPGGAPQQGGQSTAAVDSRLAPTAQDSNNNPNAQRRRPKNNRYKKGGNDNKPS